MSRHPYLWVDGWVNGWAHVKPLKSNKSWPNRDNSIMDILDILLDILLKPPQPFIGLFLTFLSGLGHRKMLTARVSSLNFLICTLSCIRGTNNILPTNPNFKSHLVTSLSIRLVQNRPSISTKICLWCMRVKINNASSSNLKPGLTKSKMYSSTVLPFRRSSSPPMLSIQSLCPRTNALRGTRYWAMECLVKCVKIWAVWFLSITGCPHWNKSKHIYESRIPQFSNCLYGLFL